MYRNWPLHTILPTNPRMHGNALINRWTPMAMDHYPGFITVYISIQSILITTTISLFDETSVIAFPKLHNYAIDYTAAMDDAHLSLEYIYGPNGSVYKYSIAIYLRLANPERAIGLGLTEELMVFFLKVVSDTS